MVRPEYKLIELVIDLLKQVKMRKIKPDQAINQLELIKDNFK